MALNTLGDDFMADVANGSEKFIQTLIAIIKAVESHKRYKVEMSLMKAQLDKVKTDDKKVVFGKMTEKDYAAIKGVEQINLQYVPSSQLDIIEDYAKKLGAKYYVFENDGKVAGIAVPDKYISQFDSVLKATIEKQMKDDDKSIITNQDNLIKAEDKEIVDEVMNFYEVPVYKFDIGEDRMNVVPKEFEGQYNAALKEASAIKAQMNSIDVSIFNQDMPLNELDYRVTDVTFDQADYIAGLINDPDISFIDYEGKVFCKYPTELESSINDAINNYIENTKIAENYKIDVIDNRITMNRSLIESETANEYFLRVPNTGGNDFIKLDKNEIDVIDNGKTLVAKLDYDKTYQIYDKNGTIKQPKYGNELAVSYNTKNRSGNEHTTTSHHFNDSLERVELYNAKDNTMMRVGLDGVSAEEMKAVFIGKGISESAADKLCSEINKMLPEQYKESFSFVPATKKAEILITEDSKDIIEQGRLAKAVEGADCKGMPDISDGRKLCVFDKKNNQYVVINADNTKEQLVDALKNSMGYNTLQAHCIAQSAIHLSDEGELKENISEVQSFDSKNPEISELKYAVDGDTIVIGKPEIIDGVPEMKNIIIQGGASRYDIENAVTKGLGIKDPLSVAECMKCMSETHIIEPPKTAEIKLDEKTVNVTKISSEYINLNFNDKNIMLPVKEMSASRLSKELVLDEKAAQSVQKSIDKAINVTVRTDNSSSLSQLKKKASAMFKSTAETAEKAAEKTVDTAKTIAKNLVRAK